MIWNIPFWSQRREHVNRKNKMNWKFWKLYSFIIKFKTKKEKSDKGKMLV